MPTFDQHNRTRTPTHEATTRRYEIIRTLVEFLAALAFVVGSGLFFFESFHTAAASLFLVGSLLFAARPTIRLALELSLDNLPWRHARSTAPQAGE